MYIVYCTLHIHIYISIGIYVYTFYECHLRTPFTSSITKTVTSTFLRKRALNMVTLVFVKLFLKMFALCSEYMNIYICIHVYDKQICFYISISLSLSLSPPLYLSSLYTYIKQPQILPGCLSHSLSTRPFRIA